MRNLILVLFLLISITVNAQYDHEPVFEGEMGETLREMVEQAFRPNVVLDYGDARDTMYAIIDNVNDSVVGIYSDHKVYLPPGEDPSTFVYMNGVANGINAEHSYPQSKGAGGGNARSDMHHIFPSRINVNSARGSLPFGEINDNITDVWYYKTQEKSSTPSSDIINLFSEKGNNYFEPREEVKGNIARAIMYFYTIYRDEANAADPGYFGIMQEDLCQWHDDDPVDQVEWDRTKMIAKWQDGKANPFVLDCTLAPRIYCGDISPACIAVDVEEEIISNISIIENPVGNNLRLIIDKSTNSSSLVAYSIIDISGKVHVYDNPIQNNVYENNELVLSVDFLSPGMYALQCIVESKNTTEMVTLRFIKTTK